MNIEQMMEESRYNIQINVETNYIPEQSSPDDNRFVFSYTVTITNEGETPAKLLSRHWHITDGDNKIQEVVGEGVVGEQPYLRPGESFQYTSGTVLETPVGSMHGSYQMIADDGKRFDATIPMFSLNVPNIVN